MSNESRGIELPPGQVRTRKFPIVGESAGSSDVGDLESWRLRVGGLVERPLELSFEELMRWPQEHRTADIHCVTGWSRLGMELTGIPLSRLLERAIPLEAARFVRFEAFSDRGHDTSLPLDVASSDTWLIHSVDGHPLTPEHGFPLRTVTPSRYFYKSLKWVHSVELLAEDRLGFWERESAYHNVGDPWAGDQRFSSGSIAPEKVDHLRQAIDLRRYRRVVHLGLDLSGWNPLTRDLSGLQLKNCVLRGASLAGVDLGSANLSLSDLRDADLRGADLRDADLEGTNFAGADLRGACLDRTLLSATRFFEERADGTRREALVEGMTRRGARGLLESQQTFLEARDGGG